MSDRAGNWMLTASGRRYWPADPRAEDVFVEDVAAHLAKLCRYTGACREFYCVAEHAVHVSRLLERQGWSTYYQLVGLHHDDPEAYLNDMNRPTKHGPRMEGYKELEELNWQAVAERFELPKKIPKAIQAADHEMLFHEASAIMPPMPDEIKEAWGMGLDKPAQLHPEWIQCWGWRQARTEFLKRHEELTR